MLRFEKKIHSTGNAQMFIYLLCSLWLSLAVHAAELKFEPATPIVEINKTVTLSVANTEGTVEWIAGKGKIQGEGNKVTYLAPDQAGLDVISVLDSKGNIGVIKVVITLPNNFSLENAQWEVFTNRSEINALLLSEDGKTLWVGTNGGLEKRDAQTGEVLRVFTSTEGLLPSNRITALLNDNNGGLWIGTDYYERLAHYTFDGQWKVFSAENSGLFGSDVIAILNYNEDDLWIEYYGMSRGSIYKRSAHYTADGQWQVFNTENSEFHINNAWTLLSDHQLGLWIGTDWGFVHYAVDGQWQTFYDYRLPATGTQVLLSDNQNGLWIGTSGMGLGHYTGDKQWQVFDKENSGLPNNIVSALLNDNQGGLWIGTDEGLAHYTASGQWRVFRNLGLPDNEVTTLLSDNKGDLWIGTEYGGLAHYRTGLTFFILCYYLISDSIGGG